MMPMRIAMECGGHAAAVRAPAWPAHSTSRRPDARLLRPWRVFVALLERLRGLAQGGAVARPLVLRHPRPILRLGRRIAVRMPLHDFPEAPLRLVEALGHERRVRQAELDLRQEIVLRQEAFDAVPLLPLAVEDQDRRRPVRAEALHRLRVLAHVEADRNEVAGDELA